MADETIRVRASSVSLGITVILLYALFVSMVSFGFGTYIYRTTWQVEALTEANGNVVQAQSRDIDNTLFIITREEAVEAARLAALDEIALAEFDLSEHSSLVGQSFGPIRRAKDALINELDLTLDALEEFQFMLPGDSRTRYEVVVNEEGIEPDVKVNRLLRIIETAFANNSDVIDADTFERFEALKSSTEAVYRELSAVLKEANTASLNIQAQKAVIESRIETLRQSIRNHENVLAELQVALPLASVARARLAALSLDATFMPDVLLRLVSFPTIFLTMIVTIAAGGLGTVVAFSRRYYSAKNSEELTLSRLFVNVGEGIAAAIAIFLFSGAGMLALTQGGGGAENSVELSPYTVAFIAFLSGFMAEDAFASIQAAGKRIFNTEENETKAANGTNLPAVIDDVEPPATTAPPSS